MSGNEKRAIVSGLNADKLDICSSDPNDPEITINSSTLALPIPVQFKTKAGYVPGIVID